MNRRSKQDRFLKKRAELFLELTQPIYAEYQTSLKERQAIDFNDMINQATDIVQAGKVQLGYRYIIIDEYQDISQSRFRLVKAIQEQTSAKVMCVGDDWQSIFRFAGSDLELFTQFGEFFGAYELLRIEKTYRNSQQLIDVAGKFVMQNPRQYRKNLRSDKRTSSPVRVIGYQQNIIAAAESVIREIVIEYGEETEIMLIGRNNFDIRVLEKSPKFSQQYNRIMGRYEISYKPYPNLTLFFLTAHRSKGREADHVILLNAANSQLGFPNRIADDPVLLWVLTNGDDFEFAEERRLFYVALTRTRNRTYILAPDRRMSLFVKELIEDQRVPYQLAPNVESVEENPPCPKCKAGRLVIRTNQYGRFVGCTNFPMCDQTLKDVEILEHPIQCSECGGYMVKRRGKFGSFYSCHNYPRCDYKYNEPKE